MALEPSPGTLVSRYRLDRHLGRGGMGTVWSAHHTVTHAQVALKLVYAPPLASGAIRRRFMDEARAASAVEHPNVIRVHDVFELEDHTLVMVMDLLTGETLGQRLRSGTPLGVREAARILRPVVEAIAAVHTRGIVHRDLKPDNVFLSGQGEAMVPKVLDFGIAKLADPERDGVTGTGTTLGTPCYMAPEQGFGESDIDGRADVWALGVVLYECLAGIRPLEADNLGQFLKQLMSAAIVPLGEIDPDLPRDLTDVCDRMLARVRDDRPSLEEVARVLGRHESEATAAVAPAPARPSRFRAAVVALVLAGGAGLAAWILASEPGDTGPPASHLAATPATAKVPSAVAPGTAPESMPEVHAVTDVTAPAASSAPRSSGRRPWVPPPPIVVSAAPKETTTPGGLAVDPD